jgi:hypothetical protein
LGKGYSNFLHYTRQVGLYFVLPDPQHFPPFGYQPSINTRVSDTIPLDLKPPKRGVSLWPSAMNLAPMPKASIDEDDHLLSSENKVRCSVQLVENAVSVPELPKLSS